MKVMLVVSSLMGVGHLTRTLLIARALKAAGAEPVVVSGGRQAGNLDPGGLRIETLPPLWSDGVDYSRLLTPEGIATPDYLERRRAALLAFYRSINPQILVTELFPFGRRALRNEFDTLLEAAHGHARIFASIRDVLEPKRKPGRAEETAERLRRFYDGVLVHGDERLIPLSATWPAAAFSEMIRYTGYIAAPPPMPLEQARGEVLVAVGGGAIGRRLLECAVEAARGSSRRWRLRVGGADAAAEAARLNALARGAPVVAEPTAPDYRARLAAAACSVSLFGYNTATDLLAAGTPAVIRPMAEGGEREQEIRAKSFANMPGFFLLDQDDPEKLSELVEIACASPGPPPGLAGLDGAAHTAQLLLGV